MKIRIQLKSPDAIHYALQDVDEEHRDSVEETLEKWLQYGEMLTVEIDTENNTCVPIPVRK